MSLSSDKGGSDPGLTVATNIHGALVWHQGLEGADTLLHFEIWAKPHIFVLCPFRNVPSKSNFQLMHKVSVFPQECSL